MSKDIRNQLPGYPTHGLFFEGVVIDVPIAADFVIPALAGFGNELQIVSDELLLSEDLQGGDYYTHYCSVCPAYWHLHIHGGGVDLISTHMNQEIASKRISDELLAKLKEKVGKLEKE